MRLMVLTNQYKLRVLTYWSLLYYYNFNYLVVMMFVILSLKRSVFKVEAVRLSMQACFAL